MARIEENVPNLVGGVSEQPASLRYPTQVDTLDDAIPSVVRGLNKRPPTQYRGEVSATPLTSGETYYHDISQDKGAQYLVSIKDGDLKVHDAITLTEETVNFPDGKTYLEIPENAGVSVADAIDSFNALTVADTTFITNKTKTANINASLKSPSLTHEALIFIKQGGYDTDYSVLFETANDAVVSLTWATDHITYYTNRPVGPPLITAYKHYVTSVTILSGGSGYTSPVTVQFDWGGIQNEMTPQTITLTNTGGVIDGWSIDATNGSKGWGATVPGALSTTHPAYHPPTHEVPGSGTSGGGYGTITYKSGTNSSSRNAETGVIASGLRNALTANSNINADFDITLNENYIQIAKKDGTDFEIQVDDGLSGSGMDVIYKEVDSVSRLPVRAPNGFKIKVSPDAETGIEDYYLEFQTSDGSVFSKGVWVETIGWDQAYEIVNSEMPHILIRNLDGTFTFKKGPWANRAVGDDTTNPLPSFADKIIQGFRFTQKRLGFLCDDSVIWSETDQPYNFFRTTVIDSLDTQPIDLAIIDTNSSPMRHMIPLEGDVLLCSAQSQLVLDLSGGFAFDTVALSQSTETDLITDAKPQVLSKDVLFCFPRGDGFGLGQFGVEPETLKLRDFDLSEQVPTYLRGNPSQILPYSPDNMVFVRSDGITNGVYFYRFLDRDRSRIQSAFGRLTFGTNARIDHMYRIGAEVYIVTTDGSATSVESFDPSKTGLKTEADGNITTLLDRRVDQTDCSAVYDAGNTETDITLPYTPDPADSYQLVEKTADATSVTAIDPTNVSGDVLTFPGDLTAANYFIGRKYTATTKLSKPSIRAGRDVAITGGRFQVLSGRVSIDQSHPFTVDVEPSSAHTSFTHSVRPIDLGANNPPLSGDYRFMVRGKSDQVSVTLKNSTPFPCSWLSIAWEGRYSKRQRSL